MPVIATLTLNPALDVTTATDAVRPTHKLRCTDPGFEPGGGGINVARVVHALGGDVMAVFPSGGPAGAMIEQLLGEAGVPIAPVRTGGATRESFTVTDQASGEQYRFVLPGPMLGDVEEQAVFDALKALDGPPQWLVASGSLPPGCEPAIFHRLAAHCRETGARLIVDTSGAALAGVEGSGAYLVKPSIREVEDLVERELKDEAAEMAAAQELVERGFAELVVMSLGERGAVMAGKDIALRMAAIPVSEGSAVGAGDAMVAGMTLALCRGKSPEEALRYGVAAGSAALIASGKALARREDVERLYASAASGASAGASQNRP